MTEKYLKTIAINYNKVETVKHPLWRFALVVVLEDVIMDCLLKAGILDDDDIGESSESEWKQYRGIDNKIAQTVVDKIQELENVGTILDMERILDNLEEYLRSVGVEITMLEYSRLNSGLESEFAKVSLRDDASGPFKKETRAMMKSLSEPGLPVDKVVPATEAELERFRQRRKRIEVLPFDPTIRKG